MSIFKNNAFDTASVGYVDYKASQSSGTSSPEIAISDTEPTEDSIELWIKKTGSETKSLPEIKDDIINTTDTWSSTKINAEIEELKGMIGGGSNIDYSKLYIVSRAAGNQTLKDMKLYCDATLANPYNYFMIPHDVVADMISRDTWTLQVKFNITEFSTYTSILGVTNTTSYASPLIVEVLRGQLNIYTYFTSNSNVRICSSDSSLIQLNTDYYLQLEFNGESYLTRVSADGIHWTEIGNYTSSDKLYLHNANGLSLGQCWNASTVHSLIGYIDLAHSYIISNDEVMWGCYIKER